MSDTPLTLIQPKVIDPDDRAEMERFARLHDEAWKRVMDRHPDRCGTPSWEIVAEQFRLFRDPTYRAKPDEPTGLGAVVEDEDGRRWYLLSPTIATKRWACWGEQLYDRDYADLTAVRVLSEGIQP